MTAELEDYGKIMRPGPAGERRSFAGSRLDVIKGCQGVGTGGICKDGNCPAYAGGGRYDFTQMELGAV